MKTHSERIMNTILYDIMTHTEVWIVSMWLITLLIILVIIPLIILLILLLSLSASPFIPVLCKNIHINQSSGHQAQWDILLKGGVFMLNGVIAHQNKNMIIKLQYACERGIIIVAFNKLMCLNWRNCTT